MRPRTFIVPVRPVDGPGVRMTFGTIEEAARYEQFLDRRRPSGEFRQPEEHAPGGVDDVEAGPQHGWRIFNWRGRAATAVGNTVLVSKPAGCADCHSRSAIDLAPLGKLPLNLAPSGQSRRAPPFAPGRGGDRRGVHRWWLAVRVWRRKVSWVGGRGTTGLSCSHPAARGCRGVEAALIVSVGRREPTPEPATPRCSGAVGRRGTVTGAAARGGHLRQRAQQCRCADNCIHYVFDTVWQGSCAGEGKGPAVLRNRAHRMNRPCAIVPPSGRPRRAPSPWLTASACPARQSTGRTAH